MLAPGTRPPLRIAMIGTRGVPAAYGGFETAVEEIGSRLAELGHEVTVYCRRGSGARPRTHLGMRLVHLPAVRVKVAETLSHSAFSVAHVAFSRKYDVAFVFNAANAPFVPALRGRGIPTAVHVDGLEWKRDKWSGAGKRYYRFAERFAVRTADALIADAQGIADYYDSEYGAPTELLSYGTRILRKQPTDPLAAVGLEPGRFHLVVARFEPENHVDVIIDGYRRSSAQLPLVVVGSAPYAAEYTRRVESLAEGDGRIRLLGGVFDQRLLDALYAHALTYAHGHSVGGTNPSLLRAMGAATSVLAWDVGFNREVLGRDGRYFTDPESAARSFDAAEANPGLCGTIGLALQERAERIYDWDDVTSGYERLATRLARGYSLRTTRHHPATASPVDSTEPS
jgi:glycosyltransferase involved in cell wall biosynthesis